MYQCYACVDTQKRGGRVAQQHSARSHKLEQGPTCGGLVGALAIAHTSKLVRKRIECWVPYHLDWAAIAIADEVCVVQGKAAPLFHARCDTLQVECACGRGVLACCQARPHSHATQAQEQRDFGGDMTRHDVDVVQKEVDLDHSWHVISQLCNTEPRSAGRTLYCTVLHATNRYSLRKWWYTTC